MSDLELETKYSQLTGFCDELQLTEARKLIVESKEAYKKAQYDNSINKIKLAYFDISTAEYSGPLDPTRILKAIIEILKKLTGKDK